MSSINHANLPYQPRRQRSRPERALPAPPPDEELPATASIERALAFASPLAPPPRNDCSPNNVSPPEDIVEAVTESKATLAPATEASTSPTETTVVAPMRVRPPVPKTSAQVNAAHLNPYHSTLPSTDGSLPTALTPLRAHYLKKTLVNQQINYELNLVTDPVLGANSLGLLGEPFILSEIVKKEIVARVGSEALPAPGQTGDLPFLRYMFHQFLLPFPFLAAAPPSFWSAKVQPFLSSFLASTGAAQHSNLTVQEREIAESLMTKEEKKEADERRKLWAKAEKHLSLMVGVGIKLAGGEEVVRIGQHELRRIEQVQEARRKKWAETHPSDGLVAFDVNVVGVRVVVEKGRVRSKSHEEFFIRTRRSGVRDVFVSRRYGDFRRLAEELRIAFPDLALPNPPPKDKSAAAAPPPSNAGNYGYYNPLRAIYGSSPAPSGSSTPRPSVDGESTDSHPVSATTPLSREKNRLTLRAYLQAILALPDISNSPVVRSFLLSSPTQLTPPEAVDIQRRLEADAVREEGRKRFREEAERRVEALREGLAQFKGDVLSREGGLKAVFEVVRRVERVDDLPPAERSVMEWGKISLAATIFQIYVASDTASETLTNLKRLHGLMPYFMLKGILKVSNPMAMIRGVLDLFLARPFGGQSLIQRMFSSSLNEDVRYLAEDIQAVQDKIEDPVLCQKIEQYVSAPFEIQEIFRKDAALENVDLLVVILRSPDMPVLSRAQFQRVFRASRAYREYKASQAEYDDSDDDMGPENDDAWLFEDLNILMKLMARKREKEALLALIFEGVTAELLKDIITIFYTPLAQVYKAASIADSLGDLQNFLNDMIRTVEQVEELSQEDPGRTVQTFIDLVHRHEQSFYSFVHNVHSKGQGLFDSLMGWIELFLSYARDGLPHQLDLEILLPHSGPERLAIMKEVDEVAQYHYKLKVAHEEKIRRRFLSGGGADQQSVEEAALMSSVMESLSIGETAVDGAGEIADEESEEEDEDGLDDMSETSSIQSGVARMRTDDGTTAGPLGGVTKRRGSSTSRTSLDKTRSSLETKRKTPAPSTPGEKGADAGPPVPPKDLNPPKSHSRRKAKRANEVIVPPTTGAIAELRPLFVEFVKPLLVVKPLKQ